MDQLREKTIQGLMWGGMNNVVQQGVGLVFGIVLGNLLSPYDYGMTAMIAIFTLIAGALQESGFKTAIANLPQATHSDYNSVFWFNVTVAAICYVALFFVAPVIARYYDTPELVPLSRYAFLGIIFNALGVAHAAHLFRDLKVREQALCGMVSVLVSNVVGVSMALLGFRYWSLATQTLVFMATNSAMLCHFSRWRPTLEFDFQPIRSMFRFSSKMLATNILVHVNNNIMNILLGRYYQPQHVGNYNQAYQWDSKVVYLLQGMLGQVAQPVFTNVASERERQLRILRKLVRFAAFLSFPMLLGFGLVGQEFILLTIGRKWLASAQLLQLLCLSGAFMPVCTVLSNLLVSKGRSGTYFLCTLAQCLLLLAAMLTLHDRGIRTMVVAYVVVYVVWTFVWHFHVLRLTGYRLPDFLKDIVPFAAVAAVVMAAVWWATREMFTTPVVQMGRPSLALLLALRVALAALLYSGAMLLLRVKMMADCIDFLRQRLRRGK